MHLQSPMNAIDRMKRLVGLNNGTARSIGAEYPTANPFGTGAGPHHHGNIHPDHALDSTLLEQPSQGNDNTVSETSSPVSSSHSNHNPTTTTSLLDVCASAIIEGSSPSPSPSKAPFTRGHRRRSTHVTRRDLEKFQKEVLGVEHHASWYDEESGASRAFNPYDPQLEELNRAFALADMSMNNTVGVSSGGPGPAMFSNYNESSPGQNVANMSRQSTSPALSHTSGQTNGGGMIAMNPGMPLNAGHQMDLHHLYEMVLELSEVLKNNREVTKSIVSSAEDIMKRGASEGASEAVQQVNGEISAARIAELERALAKEKRVVEDLKREQMENTKLIGEYEAGLGTMVEQIRNYCQNNTMHFLYQKSHYNNLLQAERDAHLESRLDRDYWHAQTMKCAEMIRTAHRLRSEEEEHPIRIVAGLQNEVRAYRNALGMEPEKPEEEYGWEILKNVPPSPE